MEKKNMTCGVKKKIEVLPNFWTGKISIFVPSYQDAFSTISP